MLATYQMNTCTESVYPGVYLFISWQRAPSSVPSAIMYSHYQDDHCRHFLSNSSEGLMSCTSRPAGFAVHGAPTGRSKMMVYGPSGSKIVIFVSSCIKIVDFVLTIMNCVFQNRGFAGPQILS